MKDNGGSFISCVESPAQGWSTKIFFLPDILGKKGGEVPRITGASDITNPECDTKIKAQFKKMILRLTSLERNGVQAISEMIVWEHIMSFWTADGISWQDIKEEVLLILCQELYPGKKVKICFEKEKIEKEKACRAILFALTNDVLPPGPEEAYWKEEIEQGWRFLCNAGEGEVALLFSLAGEMKVNMRQTVKYKGSSRKGFLPDTGDCSMWVQPRIGKVR